jgi:hypothetical protein
MKPFSEMFQKEKLFAVNNFIFIFFQKRKMVREKKRRKTMPK